MTDPVVVVARPTTSGKSTLALALAERFDGVVVNADSMQLGSVPCSRLRSGGCPRRAPERELMALQAKARATRSGHDHGFGAIEINIGLGLEVGTARRDSRRRWPFRIATLPTSETVQIGIIEWTDRAAVTSEKRL